MSQNGYYLSNKCKIKRKCIQKEKRIIYFSVTIPVIEIVISLEIYTWADIWKGDSLEANFKHYGSFKKLTNGKVLAYTHFNPNLSIRETAGECNVSRKNPV